MNLAIKQTLLEYDLSLDNKFLDLYEQLILDNLATKRTTGTQAHHVIPLGYYEKMNSLEPSLKNRYFGNLCAKTDQNNFTVNLTLTDHIRAHCYLALSSKHCWFTFLNMKALELLGCKTSDPEELLNALETETLTDSKLIYYRCWVNKDGTYKNILTKHLPEYLEQGWNLGAEGKAKLKISEKRIWISKNNENIRIYESELLKKLQEGWQIGRANNQNNRHSCWVYKDNTEYHISISELLTYLQQGFHMGRAKTN